MAGFGGVVSFELDTDLEGASQFIDCLEIPYIGPSLGGVESLVGQVALLSYYEYSAEERAEIGISDSLVRLAVGIESVDDLLTDLAQALDKAFQTETLFQRVNGRGLVGADGDSPAVRRLGSQNCPHGGAVALFYF